jgi:hypothetical protein
VHSLSGTPHRHDIIATPGVIARLVACAGGNVGDEDARLWCVRSLWNIANCREGAAAASSEGAEVTAVSILQGDVVAGAGAKRAAAGMLHNMARFILNPKP